MEEIEQVEKKEENSNQGKGIFAAGLCVGLTISMLVVLVSFFLFHTKYRVIQKQDLKNVVVLREGSDIDVEIVKKMNLLEQLVDQYFFLEPVTSEAMQDGICKGMIEALKDPYSTYISKEEFATLMEKTKGIYTGIGAYLWIDTDKELPVIESVITGSPAEEMGLKEKDTIYEIDGKPAKGLTLEEAVALIRGENGTNVTLTILHEGEKEPLTVVILRREIENPTVDFEMLSEDIAYIRIAKFEDATVDQFTEALAMAKGSQMKGLLIDLRGNPGGTLWSVVEIAKMLLPEGLVVYTEDKSGTRQEYSCDGKHELKYPLVVLIDQNSASASEILAGAIQDYKVGTLVGMTTYGKGVVQQVYNLQDGSAVKITTSRYFTPGGRDINKVGIVPDVECPFDANLYYNSEEHGDNQLEKAKEILQNLQ